MKTRLKTVLTAGFAVFSMFFGSGNLVFPLVIGVSTAGNAAFSTMGLIVTGVVMPFLGLLGIILFDGNWRRFFISIGKIPAFVLVFMLLSLLGPFGVIPRCILVTYGGASLWMPWLPFEVFSIIFCVITALLIWNHDRVIPIIGRVLTPWLILGVVVIILAGLMANVGSEPNGVEPVKAFMIGLFEGYQTMDLLAAFFFSAAAIEYLKRYLNKREEAMLSKWSLVACCIGAGLIALVYVGFVALGAKFSSHLVGVSPEQMLAYIASLALGKFAVPVVSVTIALACLTTATILAMLFSDFVHEDILRKRFNPHVSLVATLVISFFMSEVGFCSLRVFLGTVLEMVYPALIIFTLSNIIAQIWKIDFSRYAFWGALVVSVYLRFIW